MIVWPKETQDQELRSVEKIKEIVNHEDFETWKPNDDRKKGLFGISPMYRLKHSNLKVTDAVIDYMHAGILDKYKSCFLGNKLLTFYFFFLRVGKDILTKLLKRTTGTKKSQSKYGYIEGN